MPEEEVFHGHGLAPHFDAAAGLDGRILSRCDVPRQPLHYRVDKRKLIDMPPIPHHALKVVNLLLLFHKRVL